MIYFQTLKHMVFFATCACVEYFTKALQELFKTVTVLSLHGKMKHKRNKIFGDFRKLERSVQVQWNKRNFRVFLRLQIKIPLMKIKINVYRHAPSKNSLLRKCQTSRDCFIYKEARYFQIKTVLLPMSQKIINKSEIWQNLTKVTYWEKKTAKGI